MRSVRAVYGGHVLAVILTGMGQDGLRGCETLHEAGATVYAQDEGSSVVWGMPGEAVKRGGAVEVLPLPDIAAALLKGLTAKRRHRTEVP